MEYLASPPAPSISPRLSTHLHASPRISPHPRRISPHLAAYRCSRAPARGSCAQLGVAAVAAVVSVAAVSVAAVSVSAVAVAVVSVTAAVTRIARAAVDTVVVEVPQKRWRCC